MNLARSIKILGLITVLALCYIHFQVQIINLAYECKAKEKQIKELVDQNGCAEYSLLSLKSSSHLGHKVFSDESNMNFVHPSKVVKLSIPVISEDVTSFGRKSKRPKKSNFLLSLISFGAEAQAKPR
jgi:hypothetical protein